MERQPPASEMPTTFLPDFCGLRIVFAVVVIGEMLALVLSLAPAIDARRWSDLGLVSLYVQWVALTGTAALCLARGHLARLGDVAAATFAYLLLLAVILGVALAALALVDALGIDPLLPSGWDEGFVWRSLAIGAIAAAVSLRYFYVRHQWQRRVFAESRAHLEALQARIRPHFLFNSLNTVASLTRTRPEVAEATIEDLADLFRSSLADPSEGVPLEVELDLARRYLNIEQLRLGERLNVTWEVDELDSSLAMPALIVQPLLENAVYHGIEPRADGGTLSVRGIREGRDARLVIENPLGGEQGPRLEGNRMALDNIRARLAAFYGRDDLLQTEVDGDRFRAVLRLPAERGRG
ncbi:MAG: histidine kinase [Gammaproteobacteria bacterium]|nr:histidine kinase [Gammaproteobacteria bacterium]